MSIVTHTLRTFLFLVLPLSTFASTIIENKGQIKQAINSAEEILFYTSIKGGTTGVLAAAAKFPTSRVMIAADILTVIYILTASSV